MEDLARELYRGITSKDWFLVAGAALSLAAICVRWLLVKKWPKFESSGWGVVIVAVLAGIGALSNAWLADERVASTETLIGALKVWAAAVFAYVTTKRTVDALTPKEAETVPVAVVAGTLTSPRERKAEAENVAQNLKDI